MLRHVMSTVLPTGTVTFLFTDIEGSTQLWDEHAEGMREALAVRAIGRFVRPDGHTC